MEQSWSINIMSALTSMGPRFLTTIPPLGPPAEVLLFPC